MKLVLMRHGEAEAMRERDEARALTALGREQAAETAAWLLALLPADASVSLLASPYLRAQQTASVVAGTLGVPVQTVQGITPDDDARVALRAIEAQAKTECLVVVSHMPMLGALSSWLEDGSLSTGRGFMLAEARLLEGELLGAGLLERVEQFVPGLMTR